MRKKILLCVCLAMLCAGCTGPEMESSVSSATPSPGGEVFSVPGPSDGSDPAREPESAGFDPEKEMPGVTFYTLDRTTTVDGRELTLRLHGRVDMTDGFERIGISAIEVLEEETLLQTLSVLDAHDELYRQEGIKDWIGKFEWTDCGTQDGFLAVDDLNFDGFPDIRLMSQAGVVNITYLCWLWDPEAGQFTYAFSLLGYDVQIDSDANQLVAQTRSGWGQYDTDYYRYDNETRTLLHLKQIHEDQVDHVTLVYELIDGEWTQIS